MKTEQKLEISYKGFLIDQTMKTKQIYVDRLLATACKFEDNPRLATNKEFRFFLKLKDTQEFIAILKNQEGLTDKQIIEGRGRTIRINELLAIKYSTWISKKFEIFIYKFFLEHYPEVRELGGDQYNDFRNIYLPKIYHGENGKMVVIKTNIYLNNLLEKNNGWNKESKENYEARIYIYKNICADIEMGEKPKVKEKIVSRLKIKSKYHLERLKIIKTSK